PRVEKSEPVATIRIARLAHGGNCNPEPLAMKRLAAVVHNRFRVRLDFSQPTPIADLDANNTPVAHITGTDPFELSEPDRAALRKFFAAGGTLVADAAGGSRLFAKSVVEQVFPLAGGDKTGKLVSGHPVFLAGPHKLTKVQYRRDYAQAMGQSERTRPRIRAVLKNGRPVVLLSEVDMISGLLGMPVYRLKGYSPDSAEKLMTNILFQAGGVKTK
ncbi:MAG: DUF4159 domain-containing protein, partial [bacterium]|nr:DUF4159 domain-containing protein [bacterium]